MSRRQWLLVASAAFVFASATALTIWATGTRADPSRLAGGQGDTASVDVAKIREILNAAFVFPYGELVAMGEKVFPSYEAILAAPKNARELKHIFFTLRQTKGDRRRFIEPALRALTHGSLYVREEAVELLEEIGTVSEASPLVALLSDKDVGVAKRAAKALVTLGGPREVLAMDIWLKGIPPEKPGKEVVDLGFEGPSEGMPRRNDEGLRKFVIECRDALQKRLDAERSKEEKKPKKNDGNK